MDEDSPQARLVIQAAKDGQLSERQKRAVLRHAGKQSEAHIEHMIKLVGHVTVAKAHKDAKTQGL